MNSSRLILAIDTTSNFGSLALADEGKIIEEVPLFSEEGFSQVLFGHIQNLLRRHDLAIADIAAFAAASGPGSFTGVRVGLTAVKGLAEALNRPAFAVSNLQALAACGTAEIRAVLMDARRGEVYGAVYNANLDVLIPEVVCALREWIGTLSINVEQLITPDATPYRESLPARLSILEQRALAGSVARIAWQRFETGERPDPGDPDANYVRRPDAEMAWKET